MLLPSDMFLQPAHCRSAARAGRVTAAAPLRVQTCPPRPTCAR